MLSVGTTLGVAVLALGLLVPLRACGLRAAPDVVLPAGVAARARRLAAGGLAGLAAQQLAVVVALRLAAGGQRGRGRRASRSRRRCSCSRGRCWPSRSRPAPSRRCRPRPSRRRAGGRRGAGRARARGRLLARPGAAAVLAVAAAAGRAAARAGRPRRGPQRRPGGGLRAFAPGLVGYGLLALLARACYARGGARTAATATVTGWLVVAAADLVLVAALPDADRVVLLGVGHTVGVTVGGLVLVAALRAAGLPGAGRSTAAGLAGAASALALGALAALALPDGVPALLEALVVGLAAAAGFLAIARVLDPRRAAGAAACLTACCWCWRRAPAGWAATCASLADGLARSGAA